MEVLFISWDGADGGYLSGLYFPLFHALGARGIKVSTVQFTWADAARVQSLNASAQRHGLKYDAINVGAGQGGFSALKNLPRGAALIRKKIKAHGFEVTMPRSLIPGAMTLIARASMVGPPALVFDADGMMHDERADFGGLSRESPVYRSLRAVERAVARSSQTVIVRSSAAAQLLVERTGIAARRLHVAYNGRSPTTYDVGDEASRQAARAAMQVPGSAPLIIYVGSLGPKYGVAAMAGALRHLLAVPEAPHLRVFSRPGPHLTELLAPLAPFSAQVRCDYVDEHRLAQLMPAADLGLALITPSLSTRGVFPVKVAEYALCGVPAISSRSIGDVDVLAAQAPLALHTLEHGEGDFGALTKWFREASIARREQSRVDARRLALEHFGLETMCDRFERALREAVAFNR